MRLRPLAVAALAWLLVASPARPARADEATASPVHDSMSACIGAADRAQLARDERRLIQARQELLVCSAAPCPLVLRKDCAKWLDDVDARLPGVVVSVRVVSVRDESEHDLVDVRIYVDGKLLASRLDGKVLPVDPGERIFRYEPSGYAPVEQRVLVREGETNRLLTIRVRGVVTTESNGARPFPQRSPPIPVLSAALAGVGLAGVGSFAFFASSAKGSLQDLRDTCGGSQSCAQSDVDTVNRKLVIANVALGIGLVALAGAVWLYLARGESR